MALYKIEDLFRKTEDKEFKTDKSAWNTLRKKMISEDGDWVYYECGKLFQVCTSDLDPDEFYLTDGCCAYYPSNENTIVYPLTSHAQTIAESVYYFYDDMHRKNLINGSRWVNWLSDKFDTLMSIDDDNDDEYQKIYNEIREQIKELEYHKSFLS